MKAAAEIIAVGTELLTPQRSDTNSLWLTEKLNEFGIEVMLKTIVGDDEARLEEVLRDALKRSDIVITTGGLGPTEDDITRATAARAVDRPLVYLESLESNLKERFKSFGREMPEINKRQAFIIEGSEVLPNPNGSAVGLMADVGAGKLVLLPGPPRELKPMFVDHVLPMLRERFGKASVSRRVLKVSGYGESALDELISPIYRSFSDVQTSLLFNKSEVEVHLALNNNDLLKAASILDDLVGKIKDKLGIALFSTEGEALEEVVGRLLKDRCETLSVAESCTGGLIAERLTDVSGSSAYFIEGAVTYANEAKMRKLGVPAEIFERHGAVSSECAEAMAEGMRANAETVYAVSVTGIAGPDGGTAEKPVGLVFIGLSGPKGTRSLELNIPGDRYLVRWRSSSAALDYLRRRLLADD